MITPMLLAALFDLALGWPDRLVRAIGHPVIWIGNLISRLEGRLNTGTPAERRRAGTLTVVAVLVAVLIPAVLLQLLAGPLLTVLLAWPFLAARSLRDHVAAVANPLIEGNLAGARQAVSMIVGRDPNQLDEGGISRAAIESLAENASDGVIAPLFWGILLGLPGLVAYKAINTMDSMIGYRSERYLDFGRSAARLDDLVNLIPARLTGALICLVAPRPGEAWRVMQRDARQHRSPNAGWPESAMAAALGVRLSGPRAYETGVEPQPWLYPEGEDASGIDIDAGLNLARKAYLLTLALLTIGAVA
ncbi:adenosylcobinamide-phosphate synthase CbiB [Palleronia caenipelagi]|uniref:Cobalamin biosynthesis protein CobD n=1 Tax=Palleronia caenipelagi TaxID=2489174 RepID=A0A547Q8I0_9RHOB|nr:adenosylcobinamide-phosphate synthase CbiB [Palleronia caenipelagi]TRD22684.1 cobalamin biosynthesis protein CobD [Palleronia caenipelagi]